MREKRRKFKQEVIITYSLLFLLVVLILGVLSFFGDFRITGFAIFEQSNQSSFDRGSYSNTEYNGSAVILSGSNTSGSYTSKVFDASSGASWNNLSWLIETDYGEELVDNAQGSLMSGNVLLLHMNNDWLDTSGEGNNGSASGALFSTNSKLGSYAGSFDGINDKLNCGSYSSLNLQTTLTVSAWINLDTVTPAHGFHSSIIGDNANSNWWFYVGNNAKLGFLRFKGTYDAIGSNADIPAEQWVHVVVTYNNSAINEARIYIDGQLDKQGSLDGPIDALSDYIVVGDRGDTHHLDGRIDELAVWNRVLSDDEVLEIYKKGALRLNLSVKSCDDNSCSGETWNELGQDSPQDLSLTNNQYFQYKFDFLTESVNLTPVLENVSIDYTILNTAPTITLVSPQDGANYGYNESLALDFVASDSDGNLGSCWYNINSGDNATISGCANTTFNVSGDGSYVLVIYANDTQGEEVSDGAGFNVQIGAPTIELTSPIDIYLTDYDITFRYTPTDLDLEACELWGDFGKGFELNQTDTNPTSGSENTFALTLNDGTYLWNIRCNDSQGNSAFNGNKTFSIDTVYPEISVSEPSGQKTSRTGIPLTFSVSDTNLESCWFNVYRGDAVEVANTSVDCSGSTTFDVTVNADFILNLYVNDSAGHTNSTNSSFSVDTSISSSSSSSSSGSGGGSFLGGSFSAKSITIKEISNIIANPGDTKKISLNVKNNRLAFLQDCKVISDGDYFDWFSSSEVKGLAGGESYEFVFDLNIPTGIEAGKYNLSLKVVCEGVSEEAFFNLEIIEEKLKFTLIEFKREGKDYVKLIYNLQELFGVEQSVDLQFLLSNGEQTIEVKDNQRLEASGEGSFGILIPIDNTMGGELNLLVNLNSEIYSGFVEEEVILGAPISGFALFGDTGGTDVYISVAVIIAFLVFAFFQIRKIFNHKKKIKQRKKLHEMFV